MSNKDRAIYTSFLAVGCLHEKKDDAEVISLTIQEDSEFPTKTPKEISPFSFIVLVILYGICAKMSNSQKPICDAILSIGKIATWEEWKKKRTSSESCNRLPLKYNHIICHFKLQTVIYGPPLWEVKPVGHKIVKLANVPVFQWQVKAIWKDFETWNLTVEKDYTQAHDSHFQITCAVWAATADVFLWSLYSVQKERGKLWQTASSCVTWVNACWAWKPLGEKLERSGSVESGESGLTVTHGMS